MQNYYANQLLRRLGQAMRDREDDFANQPLPKRWVDLIVHLNEREQAERKGPQAKNAAPRNRNDS